MRYAVVKQNLHGIYNFSVWHHTEKEAIDESKRLAEKEKCDFIVLAEIGNSVYPKSKIEYINLKGIK
jgi:hypothetical protein